MHRWLAIISPATVVSNFVAMATGEPPMWTTYSPLAPPFLLMFIGRYMIFLPDAAKRRARQ